MKRRNFLGTAVAAITATLAPATSFATKPVYDIDYDALSEIEIVESALKIVRSFELEQGHQALAFGFEPHAPYRGASIDGLRELTFEFAFKYGSRDLWERFGMFHEIKDYLDERFGARDLSAQIAWMRSANDVFESRTLHACVVSGDFGQMLWAVRLIRYAKRIQLGTRRSSESWKRALA